MISAIYAKLDGEGAQAASNGAAGEDVVGRVVDQIDSGQPPGQLNQLLLVLAHTRDPLAEAAFGRWGTRPRQAWISFMPVR